MIRVGLFLFWMTVRDDNALLSPSHCLKADTGPLEDSVKLLLSDE